MPYKFNPLAKDGFDIAGADNDDALNSAVAPAGLPAGSLGVINGVLYFFSNGHRYKLTGTLDDPSTNSGSPYGLLLALTQP